MNIFEIGFTTKKGRIGMQLGLAVSKRHLDEIAGKINIKSQLNIGTSVAIQVPI